MKNSEIHVQNFILSSFLPWLFMNGAMHDERPLQQIGLIEKNGKK